MCFVCVSVCVCFVCVSVCVCFVCFVCVCVCRGACGSPSGAGGARASACKLPCAFVVVPGLGRGYPDIAALGHNYYVELGGSPSEVDGTSCSTPVIGGIIGLLNAYRLVWLAGARVHLARHSRSRHIAVAHALSYTDKPLVCFEYVCVVASVWTPCVLDYPTVGGAGA